MLLRKFSQDEFLDHRTWETDRLPAELALVILVPAGQNQLLSGIEHHAFHALHVQVAVKRPVPTREGEDRHRRGHADVHADHATLDFSGEMLRPAAAAGKDGGAVAVPAAVGPLNRLVE